MKSILFFGDSLTAGYGLSDPTKESYPALLQQKINASGLNAKVINAGVSGDTTETGLARIRGWLNMPIDIFVLQLGANDMIRGHHPANSASNLQRIIDLVNEAQPNAKLVMLGMELPAWIIDQRAEAFRNIYRELAQRNDMAFVPFLLEGVAGRPDLNMPDGLHPLAIGYKITADLVWKVLKDLL